MVPEKREQPCIVFRAQYRVSTGHSHLSGVLAFEQVGQVLRTFLKTLLDMEPPFELPFCQPFSKHLASMSKLLSIGENDEALHFCGLGDQIRVALQATGVRIIWRGGRPPQSHTGTHSTRTFCCWNSL